MKRKFQRFMLSWIGAITVIASAVLMGITKREEFRCRERELRDFMNFLSRLENDLDCLKSGIRDALEHALPYCETNLQVVLDKVLERLKSASGERVSEVWNEALIHTSLTINAEDKEILKSFGKGLDGGDFSAQKRNIEFTKRQLERRLDDARESGEKNGKLTLRLSLLGSIAVVILLL